MHAPSRRVRPTSEDTGPSLLDDLDALGDELERGARTTDTPTVSVRWLASAMVFSARRSELYRSIVAPCHFVVAVLEGRKGVIHGAGHHVLGKGDLLIAPRGVPYDATATPDRRTGRYRALVLQLQPEVGADLARRDPALCVSPALGAFDPARLHVVSADPVALQALLHLARTLLVSDADEAILRHRVEDLLLSLSLQHVRERGGRTTAGDVRAIARADLVLATRLLIRGVPEAEWPAPLVARRLAVSGATLRRRLAVAGLTLRTIRIDERMALAAALFTAPGARVGDVALRCGYQSPSKFAAQYRRWFGVAPRDSKLRA
jgi:AraC-like DNA-binding protein